ncbi:MAG: hypothetical protein D6742_09905 [Cyanobacteria bacterium J069]|nr:MAG: hypothetical protein D6742_09905 [Cyanobacteria bacterium J069]
MTRAESRAEELKREWRARLQQDHPSQPSTTQDAISSWLLGDDPQRFDDMPLAQLGVAQQAMDYRYRILQQRYLDVRPEQAYKNLLQRLSSLFLIRSKVRTWVALSRDRHRSVMDVLQEVIQELIQNDTYIRQQVHWIAGCTPQPRLRNALMLASIEEYCLRPIRNQPLLVYRFVNYLRRTQRGGMTQVPTGELIRLVSEEISPDDSDNAMSLLDSQAVVQHQQQQDWEEQQSLREEVKQTFLDYLKQEVEPMAAQWLELHLQGKSQEAIATTLGVPVKQVYRLREKISYHALRVFAVKAESELVMDWLGTSLENNLGLSIEQWEEFYNTLTAEQQQLVQDFRTLKTAEAIAKHRGVKVNQIMGEWVKVYLAAHALRNAAPSDSAESA